MKQIPTVHINQPKEDKRMGKTGFNRASFGCPHPIDPPRLAAANACLAFSMIAFRRWASLARVLLIMPSVAEQLRSAREARGLSITEVADITKLKGDHVRALEEGNYDYFAAPVYIRGFVRTLGRLLKINEDSLMAQLADELAQTKNFKAPPSLTNKAGGPLDSFLFLLSRVPWKIVLPVVIVVALMGLAVWAVRRNADRKTVDPVQDLGPGLYQGPKKSSGQTLPLPTAPTQKR